MKQAEAFTRADRTLPSGVSVIVPVYRGEATLPELAERIHGVLEAASQPHELILVDDGSPDGSWVAIMRLVEENAWIRGVRLMRNYGQHNALLCGIRCAGFDTVVTLDDDLQNPPEEIPLLLDRLAGPVDVVYGTPIVGSHGLLRGAASIMTKLALQGVMGVENARSVSAFRAFRTVLRNAFEQYGSPFVSIDVLLTWGTSRFDAVRVQQNVRQEGVSNYSVSMLIRHAVNMITGFTVLPLQWAVWVGFSFTLFGFAVLAYVVGRWIFEGSVVQGFPFLASIIAIFSGAQLFLMGIFGEYLARMHFRIMDRPAYSIREHSAADHSP